MILIFDKLYSNISSKYFILRCIKYLLRILANLYVYLFVRIKGVKTNLSDDTLIVSLTSYPARISKLWMVIKTLLNQKLVDNFKVILWLSENQFPKGLDSLPKSLTNLIEKGLDIRFVSDDLKSHKKYYYAFKEYPNNIVVTVDDDVLYSPILLRTLLDAHDKYSDCVICNRGIKINKEKSYRNWDKVDNFMIPVSNIMPTGIGGVLYPPHCYNNNIFNIEAIKSTCINGDDLWLNFMCRLNGTKVVHTGARFGFITVLSSQETALCIENVNHDKNDIQICSIIKWGLSKNLNFYLNIKSDYET